MIRIALLLVVAGCKAAPPLVIDDSDASRPMAVAQPHRCSAVPHPGEDAARLAVRCAEEFVAANRPRIGYTATREVMIGGKPSRQSRVSSLTVEPRAFALCAPDGEGTRAVIFRIGSLSNTGTVVEVPASLTGLRVATPRLPLVEGGSSGLRLPSGCHPLPAESRDAG
jgi:hypothetical protein